MTKIRVTVELDLTVEDSTKLREAAAQVLFDVSRAIERRGKTITDQGEAIEAAQESDANAVAYLLLAEVPRGQRLPGCRISAAEVRATELVADAPEGYGRVIA